MKQQRTVIGYISPASNFFRDVPASEQASICVDLRPTDYSRVPVQITTIEGEANHELPRMTDWMRNCQ